MAFSERKTKEFHDAVYDGNLRLVATLARDPDVNINWPQNGFTPLYAACQQGNAKVVEFLLTLTSLNVNFPEGAGATPLYKACKSGHVEIVKLLLGDRRVDVNQSMHGGSTPLSISCRIGHQDIVKELLRDGRVEFNRATTSEETPFYLACQNGHVEVASLLLARQSLEVNKAASDGSTPFFAACSEGHTRLVSLLLADPRVLVDKPKNGIISPFNVACEHGHIDIVVKLLAHDKVNINLARETIIVTPLWIAAQNGHLPVVQHILACGKEVDTKRRSRFNGKTASEHADANAARTQRGSRETDETEAVFQRRKVYCAKIAQLIRAFDENPGIVRATLRKQLGINERWIEVYLGILKGETFPGKEKLREVQELYLTGKSLPSIPKNIGDFTKLVEVDFSHNPLNDSHVDDICDLLKNTTTLKSLDLRGTKIGPKGMLKIFQTLIWNFNKKNFNLESLEVDDQRLGSYDGLAVIPIDILRLGTVQIVRFLLDLYRSPAADPLFRSKVMVVGYAEIGKTSLIGCLFPKMGILLTFEVKKKHFFSKDEIIWHECFVKLTGNNLEQSEVLRFGKPTCRLPKAQEYFGTVMLSKREGWSVEKIDNQKISGFRIRGPNGFLRELYCTDKVEREEWFFRISGLLEEERTRGIDIRQHDVTSHPVVKKHFEEKSLSGKVELSVWDFAGQHEYYNHHHHFLSTRSVFLVLWNVMEFDENVDFPAAKEGNLLSQGGRGAKFKQGKGIPGLEFWLSSLSFHLNVRQQEGDASDYDPRDYYRILVVGTHYDKLSDEDKNKMRTRRFVVQKLCDKHGLTLGNYLEVSCVDDLTNIDGLQDMVFDEVVKMKYMGERIPKDYLFVETYIEHLRELPSDYPIVDITVFYEHFPNERLVRRALHLLHEWGRCVYFGNDERLKGQVVLNPQFLSKTTLAGLFSIDEEAKKSRKKGVILHEDLPKFWSDPSSPTASTSSLVVNSNFWDIAETLMKFMEKFDVCFVLPEDRNLKFREQRSFLPSLLPERKNDRAINKKLSDIRGQIEAIQGDIEEQKKELQTLAKLANEGKLAPAGMVDFRNAQQSKIDKEEALGALMSDASELEEELVAAQPWKKVWGDELRDNQRVQFERVFQFGSIPAELISRMLARLHDMIESDCVSRDCALLQDTEGTQAKVTADIPLDQFTIEIRAASLEHGEQMLSKIKGSISKVLDLYPQVSDPAPPPPSPLSPSPPSPPSPSSPSPPSPSLASLPPPPPSDPPFPPTITGMVLGDIAVAPLPQPSPTTIPVGDHPLDHDNGDLQGESTQAEAKIQPQSLPLSGSHPEGNPDETFDQSSEYHAEGDYEYPTPKFAEDTDELKAFREEFQQELSMKKAVEFLNADLKADEAMCLSLQALEFEQEGNSQQASRPESPPPATQQLEVSPTIPLFTDPTRGHGVRSQPEATVPSLIVEGVRSPYSDQVIPLEMFKEKTERFLTLGDEPLISVMKLKELAGLVESPQTDKKQVLRTSSEWNAFEALFKFLGGDPACVTEVFDIEDLEYKQMFEANRKSFFQQQQNSPGIFLKTTHKSMDNRALREEYLGLLRGRCESFQKDFGGKEDGKTDVLAMVHGTQHSVGWKIARGGFGIVASVDKGFYGQGIYFTNKVPYAMGYTLSYNNPVLVIAMVNPGNTFPVTEHPAMNGSLEGTKCKLGYQSHYCATGTGFYPTDKVTMDSNDELVVFERAQALPKYLVYYK